MKDIVISKARCKTEVKTLLVCCLIACLANLGAIIYYKSPAIELITSLGYVIIFAFALYILWVLIRLTVYAVYKKIFRRR